jgi:transposase
VPGDERALAGSCPALLPEDAGQRRHPLRKVFNGLRYLVRHGVAGRALPDDLRAIDAGHRSHGVMSAQLTGHVVHDRARCRLRAGCFEMPVHDLRAVPRLARGRPGSVQAPARRQAAPGPPTRSG